MKKQTDWYKNTVFYQIWPRSFKDGNGDGIGDLYGVYEKLDYIRSLGVGGIWFSPLYVSPQVDYGYDIADYRNIAPEYGDLEIFRKVLDKAHSLGMKVIMDLVVNHTSDQHPWFQASRDPESPYRDYYHWKKGKGKDGRGYPNNWDGLFTPKPWTYDEKAGAYYLHLFSEKQTDLNMDNPAVRNEVKEIMRYWLDMGVDGFREDVITYISKPKGLPSDFLGIPRGMHLYNPGPHLEEYLAEFRHEVLDNYDCFVVGEAPMLPLKDAVRMISDGPDKVLDMMFTFEHMNANCMFTEYMPLKFKLTRYKKAISKWQKALDGKGWNALYIENHDHPRIINRYGSTKYRVESGKMLAVSYMLLKGTPFIYQGQEIGMENICHPNISDYVDCVAHNQYKTWSKIYGKKRALKVAQEATRDNARTPVQWDSSENAGFTTGTPWFPVNGNYPEINNAAQEADPDSILNFYRRLIAYRSENPAILSGSLTEYNRSSESFHVYSRSFEGKTVLVFCSFSDKEKKYTLPDEFKNKKGKVVISNYGVEGETAESFIAKPYETRVMEFDF